MFKTHWPTEHIREIKITSEEIVLSDFPIFCQSQIYWGEISEQSAFHLFSRSLGHLSKQPLANVQSKSQMLMLYIYLRNNLSNALDLQA